MLVTAEPTTEIVEPTDDHPTAARALELADDWYPDATCRVTTMVSEAEAVVLIEVEDQVKILRYENLDADVPRCEVCGRAI